MNFNDFNLNKNDYLYLGLLFLFICALSYRLMDFQMSGGMYSPDECLYLISAMKYAGLDFYNICDVNDLFFTPVVSFLTSLLLRCGLDGHFSISFVSLIFGIFSILGMYVLLKYRFDSLLCLTGSILFGSFSTFLLNYASGLIDIPGVAVSIWMVIFGLMAIDKNPKYFYLLFPLCAFGFFTRYTSIFVVPAIFLYYLIKKDVIKLVDIWINDKHLFKKIALTYFKSAELKCIISSMIITVILTFLFCKFTLFDYNAPLRFFEHSISTLHVSNQVSNAIDFNSGKLYYLKGFDNNFLFGFNRDFNFQLRYTLFLIIFGGLAFKLINILLNLGKFNSFKSSYKTKYFNIFLMIILVISTILSFIESKFYLNHLISNIFLIISLITFFSLIKQFNINEEVQSLNLMMFALFCIYFIFISIYPIKTYRYAIPFLPSIVYFVIYGLDSILHSFSFGLNSEKLKSSENGSANYSYAKWTKIIPILLILILLCSTFSYIAFWKIEENPVPSIEHINDKGYVNDLVNITEYVKSNDPDYHSKTFGCYDHPTRMIRYYLQTNVTISDDDNKVLDSSNVDYIIINDKVDFKNYEKLYRCGEYFLYSHN